MILENLSECPACGEQVDSDDVHDGVAICANANCRVRLYRARS